MEHYWTERWQNINNSDITLFINKDLHAVLFKKNVLEFTIRLVRDEPQQIAPLKFPEKCILTRKSLHKWRARTIIKVGALICCVLNALAGTHTHTVPGCFSLWAKWVYHFTLVPRAGWDSGAPQSDSCSAHAPRALSLPASALLTSHVAALGWQSLGLRYQLRVLYHGGEENNKRAEVRRKTASCLSLQLHLLFLRI